MSESIPLFERRKSLEMEIYTLKEDINTYVELINDKEIKKSLDEYIKDFFELLNKKDYKKAIEENQKNWDKIIKILTEYSEKDFIGIDNEPVKIVDGLKSLIEKKYDLYLLDKQLNLKKHKYEFYKFKSKMKSDNESIIEIIANSNEINKNDYMGFDETIKKEIYFYDNVVNDIKKYKKQNKNIDFIKKELKEKYSNYPLFKEKFELKNINSTNQLLNEVYKLSIEAYKKQKKAFTHEIADNFYLSKHDENKDKIKSFKERVISVNNKLEKFQEEINKFEIEKIKKSIDDYKSEKYVNLCCMLDCEVIVQFEYFISDIFKQIDKANGIVVENVELSKEDELNNLSEKQKAPEPNRYMKKMLQKKPTQNFGNNNVKNKEELKEENLDTNNLASDVTNERSENNLYSEKHHTEEIVQNKEQKEERVSIKPKLIDSFSGLGDILISKSKDTANQKNKNNPTLLSNKKDASISHSFGKGGK